MFGISWRLIAGFLRHPGAREAAFATLARQALPLPHPRHRSRLEQARQPARQSLQVFAHCQGSWGLPVVAHAPGGRSGGTSGRPYGGRVKRIDHGVRCKRDPRLVGYLADHPAAAHRLPLQRAAQGV